MPKYRRMEKSNGASGEDPEYGAIFMSSNSTRKECLRQELFGSPMGQAGFVKQVKAGMMLFLFDFENRELHGVFQASSDGAMNIDPNAYRSSGKQFPAQVKFTEKWRCRPLRESEFRHAICENYFTATKFNFGLSKVQVQRLLKLFSLKKVERSRMRTTAAEKPTRQSESNLGNTVGDHGFANRCAGETDGEVDREFPFKVTSARDRLGRRLIENYGFGDESDIGLEYYPSKRNEYSGDISGVFRRLVDPKLHVSKDRVGYDLNMNNRFGGDALTNNSSDFLVNDRGVPKNLRHNASGWLEKEHHEKDGIALASSRGKDKEHLNFEADPVVPAQSLPLDLPYGTNTEYYDPCDPGIMENATRKSFRHDLGEPSVDLMGSAPFTANSNYGRREEIIPVAGYVSDALPSETVQPFPDEHNGTSMNKTSILGEDYYIPMPTEHLEYQTNTGMIGGACSEFEFRNGHWRHSQFPGLLTPTGATENMRECERFSYSDRSIFPSFAYPLSSRDLSPKDGINNKILAYQHQDDYGGRASYSNMVVRGSSIYPSFTYPSTSGDGADLYPENISHNDVQAYQQHELFGSDVFDSNNGLIQTKDCVNPDAQEKKRTRKSVFSRLAMPSKERDAEKDTSPPDTESVDEVMAFLNDCHKHWMAQKRPNMTKAEDFGKAKKKKEKICTEVLDDDMILPFTETTPDDLLNCEESMEDSAQKLPLINFKRRSKAQKSLGNPIQGCKDSPEHSASQNKRRKLLRPKLIEDDSEKDRGNNDDPIKNVLASQSATEVTVHGFLGRGKDDSAKERGNNDDPTENVLASLSATEVTVHGFLGRDKDDSAKERGNNDDPTENVLASLSATEVTVHDVLGVDKADSEKDRRNNDDPIENVLVSQPVTGVTVHDVIGRDKDDMEKERGNNDDPIKNILASQSAIRITVHDFLGRDKDDSEKERGNDDDPTENFLASQSATGVTVHDFIGRDGDGSEKEKRNNHDPLELASQSATEVTVHDLLGRDKDDSEKERGNNDDPTEKFLASQSATRVTVHDFIGRDGDGSEKEKRNNDDPLENVLASQSATGVTVHDFLGRDKDDSEKNRADNDDPVENVLASQSATEVTIYNFIGRDDDDSEEDRGNNDDPLKIFLASQSATEVPFHDFFGRYDQ